MMTMSQVNDEYMDLWREIVEHARVEGGYCVGLVSAWAWQRALTPDRLLLSAAIKCASPDEAEDVFEIWLRSLEERR